MKCKSRTRQGFLVATALLAATPLTTAQEPHPPTRRIVLRVSESAGIRRFGYPVSVVVPLAGAIEKTDRFRLLDGDTPLTAQIQVPRDDSSGSPTVAVDFNASPAPFECREYVLEYGRDVAAGTKPRGGLRLEQKDGEFRILHSSDLQFAVPADLSGLLAHVRTSKTDYLRPDSAGLLVRDEKGNRFRVGGTGTKSRVVKEGPLAVTLRFDCTTALRDGTSVTSIVDTEFVSSKSWVKMSWTVDDPKGAIAALDADFNLNVEGDPTLVDFGASTSVYAQLRKGQTGLLRQNSGPGVRKVPAWETFTGPTEGRLAPYVVAPGHRIRGADSGESEGWAHVMDQKRCTAVAVDNFSAGSEIRVDSDGRLRLHHPAAAKGRKLVFWLHFVPMPVHVGAATSPQAMLAPLEVEIARKPRTP